MRRQYIMRKYHSNGLFYFLIAAQMKTYLIAALYSVSILFFSFPVFGQTPSVAVITSGTKTSLRGLSVVNDNIIWVSGSGGTVGKSLNAGKNWNWMTV